MHRATATQTTSAYSFQIAAGKAIVRSVLHLPRTLQEHCQHSDKERAISGVWKSIELSRAVVKGYTVVRIVEVWHFPQMSDKLFARIC